MKIKQIINNWLALTIIVLMLYSAVSLMSAVKFLGDDPFIQSMPYQQVSAFSHVLLNLALMTGVLGCGLMITSSINDGDGQSSSLLLWITRGWMLLTCLVFAAGLFSLLEGRHLLELPPLLDVVQVLLAIGFIAGTFLVAKQRNSQFAVWMAGASIVTVGTAIGVVNAADVVRSELLRGAAVGLVVNLGYPLALVAICFWLSGVTESRVYVCAGLIAIAGALLSVGTMHSVNPHVLNALTGLAAAVLAPIAYIVFFGFSYREANQWQRLSVGLLLAGGFLGSIQALPAVNQWVQGTRLSDLQITLMSWSAVVVVLAVIHHTGGHLRLWDTLAFWLTASGVIVGTIALASAGLVQMYLERILSIGYLETQTYLIPLYLFWVIGLLVLSLGVAVFAMHQLLHRHNI